jgi:hypothetical protein
MSEWRAERSLPAKIENLKKGFQHAKREYSVCFDEFERDHELQITNFEAVVDTAALSYLVAQFKSNAPFWRLVLLSETAVFCVIVTWLKASQPPWAICLGGALVRSLYAFATFMKKPYLYVREGQVDVQTRTVTIILMIFGAILDKDLRDKRGTTPKQEAAYAKLKESEATIATRQAINTWALLLMAFNWIRLAYLCRFHEMLRDFRDFLVFQADAQVVSLLISYVDWKCYAFEDSNYGLQMMRQWDALIDRHQATMYSVPWLSPRPANLLSWYETLVVIRWAAIRDIRVTTMRTPTGQCILHSAMLKGEPEVVAWLLYNHPELLAVTDDQRDSPVIICLKELSATLLRHHKKPSDKTAWKRAKLAEILLSDQVQQFRVPWNLTHFRVLCTGGGGKKTRTCADGVENGGLYITITHLPRPGTSRRR